MQLLKTRSCIAGVIVVTLNDTSNKDAANYLCDLMEEFEAVFVLTDKGFWDRHIAIWRSILTADRANYIGEKAVHWCFNFEGIKLSDVDVFD